MRRILLLRIAVYVAIIGVFALPAVAQKQKAIDIDKDGEFHVGESVNFGGLTVPPGMYRVYEVMINSNHYIVIRKLRMSRSAKTMGPLRLEDEVARAKCTVELTDQRNKKSRLILSEKLGDRRTALEISFRDEPVKHVLISR